MKILVVDDEQDLCEILQYNLETEGYEVTTVNSAEVASCLSLVDYDLILLDVMMGQMSGFQFARKLKDNAQTSQIPIIFITALEDEDNIVKGLNIGADDYMVKPLSLKELKARVKTVLRRTSKTIDNSEKVNSCNEIRFNDIVVDLNNKCAKLAGQDLSLTKLEFELLSLLLQNPYKVYSREELIALCWPQNVYVIDRTVDVNITRLRRKIGRYGQNIKTRVGYGYCFEE